MSDMIEFKSSVKRVRVSPRKLMGVANALVGMCVDEALVKLKFINKQSCKDIVYKGLHSALHNVINNESNIEQDKLYIKTMTVGLNMIRKKLRPRARGRSAVVRKRWSNLYICLSKR